MNTRTVVLKFLDNVAVERYNIYMKDNYKHRNTSVSMINYHLVFCPRYRRKIFLIDGLEARFKELVLQICEQNDFELLAMECDKDHCHIFVNVPPTISAADAVRIIKSNTSGTLRQEFPQLAASKSLWTRSYFASTAGNVSAETIKQYILDQKNHP